MAWGVGSDLRPWGHKPGSGVRRTRGGGPGPAGPPRTPLPLPRGRRRRREPPGPVRKMADGPGVACHPRRRHQPAMPATLQGHPTLTTRGPGDPASPHPHPGPARPGRSGSPRRRTVPQPHGRALTQSRLRGRQAARAEARRRRQRRAGSREAGGGGGPSARRWRDPRLPPTPRWRPSRLLLRPAKSGTFKNPCARNRPPARPRALPPPSAPPRPLRAPQRPPEGPGPPSSRPQDRPAAAQASRGAPNRRGGGA
ncbi:proline-rich protein HaeIII subfamily 1-like [Panthera pardus]|uniref:Proline-rich protein HaeIII subfamily 1-like n=1 Tax=Panthera pardus TaxID=9691 RepID=A0A9W2VU85_PANPR|nr:proline-rich protein HaeIII subfamily 1-like [Panthera pardus]